MISTHKSNIVNIKTSPYDDNLIATCSKDGTICLWILSEIKLNLNEISNLTNDSQIEIQNLKNKLNRNFGFLLPFSTFNHEDKTSFNPFNFMI